MKATYQDITVQTRQAWNCSSISHNGSEKLTVNILQLPTHRNELATVRLLAGLVVLGAAGQRRGRP